MRSSRSLRIIVMIGALAVCPSATTAAKVIYVDSGASEMGNGSSWTNAYKCLWDALATATAGDEVRVGRGVYYPDRTTQKPTKKAPSLPNPQDRTFELKSGVVLKGGFAGPGAPDPNERDVSRYETILSGDLNGDDEGNTGLWGLLADEFGSLIEGFASLDNSRQIVTTAQTDATAVLDGFTLTGATACALFNEGGSPTITNCLFTHNTIGTTDWRYQHGAALLSTISRDYSTCGSPSVSRCTFRENSSPQAGGALSVEAGTLTLTGCNFVENVAYSTGGAIWCAGSTVVMTDCVFEQNMAEAGGAVDTYRATLEMTECKFVANLADTGGAFHLFWPVSVTAKDCVFQENQARSEAGAVYYEECTWGLPQSPVTFERCTFTGNAAGYAGGALSAHSLSDARQDLIFRHCLFTGNRAEGLGGAIYESGYAPVTVSNCTFADNWAAAYAALAWADYRLPWGSVAPSLTMTNCILWDGAGSIPPTVAQWDGKLVGSPGNAVAIIYSDVRGGWPDAGNLDVDPRFVHPGARVDASDPNVHVEPHDPNATWLAGDYHLKSQAGRWDPNSQTWVIDDVTSPCIDAGDPNTPIGDEPQPNGGRINMGAYGGTAEASKSR